MNGNEDYVVLWGKFLDFLSFQCIRSWFLEVTVEKSLNFSLSFDSQSCSSLFSFSLFVHNKCNLLQARQGIRRNVL